jgi:hypothetical protein
LITLAYLDVLLRGKFLTRLCQNRDSVRILLGVA